MAVFREIPKQGAGGAGQEPSVPILVARILNKQKASLALREVSEHLPAQQLSLGHLKRIRKTDQCLELALCPEDFWRALPEAQRCKLRESLELSEPYSCLVPAYPPQTREEFEEMAKFWPVSFHPVRNPELEFPTELEQQSMAAFLRGALADALASGGQGAVIVSPRSRRILAVASSVRKEWERRERLRPPPPGDPVAAASWDQTAVPYYHPLHTPSMLCIMGVSFLHVAMAQGQELPQTTGQVPWGALDSQPCPHSDLEWLLGQLPPEPDPDHVEGFDELNMDSEAHYICTGLDIYLTHEPSAMDAMALVHSRIRRVIFALPRPDVGALESDHHIHGIRSLNHNYRVFTLASQYNEAEACGRPGPR